MSTGGFTVETATFGASLRELSRLNDKSQSDNLLDFARTTLTNRDRSGIIDLTPPAGQGAAGQAAKQQGERAIERDLSRLFIGVRLKGERKEQHPDVESLHRAALIAKRPGARMRNRGSAKFYVDAKKLRALAVKLKSHVGRLAAAWLVSTDRLGITARVPAWIRRHGAGAGAIHVQLQGPAKSIEMVMHAPEGSPVGELERRVSYALQYTDGRIARAIDGAVAADARKAGFRAS